MLDNQEIAAHLLRERLGLTAHIYSIVRNYHLAEDIFQETCVKALGQAGSVESKRHLLNWFRLASRNRAIDLLRARGVDGRQLSEQALATLEESWETRRSSQVRKSRRSKVQASCRSFGERIHSSHESSLLNTNKHVAFGEVAGMRSGPNACHGRSRGRRKSRQSPT